MRKREYDATLCVNDRFKTGQLYTIRHGKIARTMRVMAVSDGVCRFVDVYNSRIKCSGEIFQVSLPTCQSCNIDGCDMVFSYDALKH